MKRIGTLITILVVVLITGIALAADVVPTDIQQPGTQLPNIR